MTNEEAIEILNAHHMWTGEPQEIIDVRKENKALEMAIQVLSQEPCDDDVISRKSIKQKLQEHHDFFVNAYGGFSNLPQNDKARVDEITNCIAMVVNEPSVTQKCEKCDMNGSGSKYCDNCGQKSGKWIETEYHRWRCSVCREKGMSEWDNIHDVRTNFCPYCGAKMESEEQTE